MKTLKAAVATAEVPAADAVAEALGALGGKLDQLIRLMDDQVHLQRVALLDQGHILHFHGPDGVAVALSLPDAVEDYVQRVILRTRTFYEAKLLSMVQALGIVGPESTVCDVGANIGNHSVYFARIMGAARVLSYEPQPHCHATLSTNIALNGLAEQVTAYNCMIGATSGNGRLAQFNARNLGGARFRADEAGGVAMFALDDILTPLDRAHLDLIKIDVEGMQLEVLQGALDVLSDRSPAIWVEVLEKDPTRAETDAFLEGLGYKGERLGPSDWLYR